MLKTNYKDIFTLSSATLNKYDKDLYTFLLQWKSNSKTISVQTSGSTGIPQKLELKREVLIQSAKATNKYFNLDSNSIYLLCLPSKFIGGKMMLIRAITSKAKILISKASSPLLNLRQAKVDFCAMTSFQAARCLEKSIDNFNSIDKLIIGGSGVNNELLNKLRNIKTSSYSTFGMSETASHIALRKLDNNSEIFECLSHIDISADKEDRLIITSKQLEIDKLVTNDIVEIIDSKRFKWIARKDNVINSGGIKIYPELVEKQLSKFINIDNFFIDKAPHKNLGQQVVIVLNDLVDKDLLLKAIDSLDKYQKPKLFYQIREFTLTNNNKLNRAESKKNAKEITILAE